MELLNQLLNESASEVYHFTHFQNALSILSNGAFVLTPTFKSIERSVHRKAGISPKKDTFFLSTTRSLVGSYHMRNNQGILFTLDANELKKYGSLRSVVYYKEELEDRVVSTESEIPVSVISAAKILMSKDLAASQLSNIRKIAMKLKQLGVPVKFVDNPKNWTHPGVGTEEVPENVMSAINTDRPRVKRVAPRSKTRTAFPNMVRFLLLTKMTRKQLPDEAYRFLSRYFTYRNDVSVLSAEFHNLIQETIGSDRGGKSTTHDLAKLLKKLNIQSEIDLFDFMKNKFD